MYIEKRSFIRGRKSKKRRMIEGVALTGNLGYSFFRNVCKILVGERQRGEELERAAETIIIFSLLPQKIEG